MTETWLPVPGYEGHYEVSSIGRVRSVITEKSAYRNYWGGVIKKPQLTWKGYHTYTLYKHGVGTAMTAHKAVLLAFVGPRPEGYVACHANGDKTDNRVSNLRWDTVRANHLEKKKHGTFQSGEQHGMAKLCWSDVHCIRNSAEPGTALARRYKVSTSTICDIRKRRIWKTNEMNLR